MFGFDNGKYSAVKLQKMVHSKGILNKLNLWNQHKYFGKVQVKNVNLFAFSDGSILVGNMRSK